MIYRLIGRPFWLGKVVFHFFSSPWHGDQLAGVCDFDQTKYQKRKEIRVGTRAGSIAIYCANEAILSANLNLDEIDTNRIGVYIGITEHGNVETETEVCQLFDHDDEDVKYWTHHHNPRTVANNPAGEITINLGLTGPRIHHWCSLCRRKCGNYSSEYNNLGSENVISLWPVG